VAKKKKTTDEHYAITHDQLAKLFSDCDNQLVEDADLSVRHLSAMFADIFVHKDADLSDVISDVMKTAQSHRFLADYFRGIPTIPPNEKERYWKKFSNKMSASAAVLSELLDQVVDQEKTIANAVRGPRDNQLFHDFERVADPRDYLSLAPRKGDMHKKPWPPVHTKTRRHFEDVLKSLQWAGEIGGYLKEIAREDISTGGAKADEYNDRLILRLADTYEKATKFEADAPYYVATTSSYDGYFIKFSAPCITALEPDLEWDEVAGRIRRVFKTRKPSAHIAMSMPDMMFSALGGTLKLD
jgi:hypothetical protein